jgi:hypothetical protein
MPRLRPEHAALCSTMLRVAYLYGSKMPLFNGGQPAMDMYSNVTLLLPLLTRCCSRVDNVVSYALSEGD